MKKIAGVFAACVVCALVALMSGPSAYTRPARAQTSAAAYCIWDVDASKHPTVQLKLRVLNDRQQLESNQTSPQLFENGVLAEGVQLLEANGPLFVNVVVDGGRSPTKAQKDAMRKALGRFADRVRFVDGMDAAQIHVLINNSANASSSDSVTRLPWTDSKTNFNAYIATDFFATNKGPTKGLEALEKAKTDLIGQAGSPVQQAAVILFMTNRIEATNTTAEADASKWANLLNAQHIPVYALQTDRTERNRKPVIGLAGPGRYVSLVEPFEPQVDSLFEAIAAHRTYYSVTFTSKLGTPDPRIITWSDPAGRGVDYCRGEGRDTYTYAATDPDIEFDNLPNTLVFGANTAQQLMRVRVQWPPGPGSRELAKAQLLVDDVSKAEGDFSADYESVEFEVNAGDFGNKPKASLRVLLTDKLGRQIRSPEKEIRIEQEQPLVIATATVVQPETTSSSPLATVAATLGVLALLGAAVGGGFYVWRQRQNPRRSGGWRANIPGTPGLASHVAATLVVLDGPHGQKDRKFKLSKTTYVIGRQGADIEFYRDAETSTVSRRHCTITRDRDLSFWITDTVSSNGTQIIRGGSTQPVLPNVRSALLSGDQVVLGDLRRNGVLLQFTIDNPTQLNRSKG